MIILNSTDFAKMEQRYRATMFNSLSGFKSLQMVATINKSGKTNIGLFNSIFHIGANPFLIGMVCRPDGDQHETFNNIETIGNYTLNNVKVNFYKQAHQTSARFTINQSEFKECNFTEYYLDDFNVPFIKESSIKLGLSLKEVIKVQFNGSRILIGEVVKIILDNELILKDGFVDINKASSVTVCGLDSYYSTEHLSRLKYAKPNYPVEEI